MHHVLKMIAKYLEVDNAIRSQAENSVKSFLDLQCSTWKHIAVHKTKQHMYLCVFKVLDEETSAWNICAQTYASFNCCSRLLAQLTSSRQLVRILVGEARDRRQSLQNAHCSSLQASCWCTKTQTRHSLHTLNRHYSHTVFENVQYWRYAIPHVTINHTHTHARARKRARTHTHTHTHTHNRLTAICPGLPG